MLFDTHAEVSTHGCVHMHAPWLHATVVCWTHQRLLYPSHAEVVEVLTGRPHMCVSIIGLQPMSGIWLGRPRCRFMVVGLDLASVRVTIAPMLRVRGGMELACQTGAHALL